LISASPGRSDAIASGDRASRIACCGARTHTDPYGYAKEFNVLAVERLEDGEVWVKS
jgi:hypothetical protein